MLYIVHGKNIESIHLNSKAIVSILLCFHLQIRLLTLMLTRVAVMEFISGPHRHLGIEKEYLATVSKLAMPCDHYFLLMPFLYYIYC